MENDTDVEYIQTIKEIPIVENANDRLRINDEETIESKNISGRLRPIPLTTNHIHIHKYERGHQ